MKHYPTYGQSLILLVIWLLATLLSVLAVIPFFGLESGIGMSLMYTLSMVLTVVAGLFMRANWNFSMNSFPVPILVYSIVLMFCLPVLLDPLTSAIPVSDTLMKLMEGILNQPIAFFFMAVIAAPILEEMMFRGIILDGYLKNYKPWHGILISGALFGLIHGNLAQGIGAFLLGVLFGWVYWKTKSILAVVILHFVNNGAAFIATLLTPKDELTKSLRDTIANDTNYFALYAGCLVAAIALVYTLNRKFPEEPPAVMPLSEPPTTPEG
jgi:uncharacterized protein